MRSSGHLLPTDSVYAGGEGTVLVGGAGGAWDDPVSKYVKGYYQATETLITWATGRLEATWSHRR
jgi:hypothetical protein